MTVADDSSRRRKNAKAQPSKKVQETTSESTQRGGVPAYYKLYVLLAQRIRDNELSPGDPLPSESQMTADFGVSRVTVRKALELLEKDGLVLRRRGARSCVAAQPQKSAAPLIQGPVDNLLTRGLAAGAKTIEVGWKLPPADAVAALRLEANQTCFHVCRLRMRQQEDAPFSYSRVYVSPEASGPLIDADLGNDPVLVHLERAGISAVTADQTLSATLAQDPAAKELDVPIGSALIELRRTVFEERNKPIIYQVSLYRPDQYEYFMRLSRDNATMRPQWRHT